MAERMALARRKVDWREQEQFAALSADRNPIHMDEVAARRTQAGQPVVHGVHTLLWALDSLVAIGRVNQPIIRVKVRFAKWVYLGDEAVVTVAESAGLNPSSFQVDVLGMLVVSADLTYGEVPGQSAVPADEPVTPIVPLAAPRKRSTAELAGIHGVAYTSSGAETSEIFPRLAELTSGTAVAELAACSYVVGMEVPGLNSMFSKLDIKLHSEPTDGGHTHGLHFSVTAYDERFHKVRVNVTGASIQGMLEAFVQKPAEQPTIGEVSGLVAKREFEAIRALVVGGSRGLGELTAKLIAAGGGSVTITYASGKSEAEAVIQQISDWGRKAAMISYDVRADAPEQLAALDERPTHVFYFATNTIFRPKGELVSAQILSDFMAFYVKGFYDLCVALASGRGDEQQQLTFYYPSSIAVEDRPAGMTEYAMAKAAGEQMCLDLERYMPNLRIVSTRLPRLRTDQTATVVPEREQEAVHVLLPILRAMMFAPDPAHIQ